jgi:transketolase
MSQTSTHGAFDRACANAIRTLTLDAVQTANSGHPGMPMGMANVAYVLYTRFLQYNPKNPKWFNRDRVIISAGHGSMLLYSVNYLTGYDLSLDDLARLAQARATRLAWRLRKHGWPHVITGQA